jgi:hypothetical protein
MWPLVRIIYRIFRGFFSLIGLAVVLTLGIAILVLVDIDEIDLALNCGEPCIIRDNPGGSVYLFQLAADRVLGGARKQIIIDGECASACAFFAEKARPRVCVTKKARMGYHQGIVGDDERLRFVLQHAPDIHNWVMRRGGFPANGMLWMEFVEARKFWPVCAAK